MFEEEKPEVSNQQVFGCLRSVAIYLLIMGIVTFILVFCNGCVGSRIVDAQPAKLEYYSKVKNSTWFTISIRLDSCTTYKSKWDSHCWQCTDAAVPTDWNVITYSNGKSFSEPVK